MCATGVHTVAALDHKRVAQLRSIEFVTAKDRRATTGSKYKLTPRPNTEPFRTWPWRGFAARQSAPQDLLEFALVKSGIDPVRLTQISPNGNLAQLVEQRTLNP